MKTNETIVLTFLVFIFFWIGARFDDGAGGNNEVQRTMLELINQLDGFDPRGNIKVLMATNRRVLIIFIWNVFDWRVRLTRQSINAARTIAIQKLCYIWNLYVIIYFPSQTWYAWSSVNETRSVRSSSGVQSPRSGRSNEYFQDTREINECWTWHSIRTARTSLPK